MENDGKWDFIAITRGTPWENMGLIWDLVRWFMLAKLVNIRIYNVWVDYRGLYIYSIHGGYKPTNITGRSTTLNNGCHWTIIMGFHG